MVRLDVARLHRQHGGGVRLRRLPRTCVPVWDNTGSDLHHEEAHLNHELRPI
jgi:hypothetical protein